MTSTRRSNFLPSSAYKREQAAVSRLYALDGRKLERRVEVIKRLS